MFPTIHAAVGSQGLLAAFEELVINFVKSNRKALAVANHANRIPGKSAPPGSGSGLSGCVILGKLLVLSGRQSPHL